MFNPDYGSKDFNQTARNMIRAGKVTKRRNGANGPEIKYLAPDRGVESDWIPYSQSGSSGCAFHYLPRIGDNVTVLHDPHGIERAIAIGTNATTSNPTFTPSSLNSIAMKTENGAWFEYDPDSGILTVVGIAQLVLRTSGDAKVAIGGDLQAFVGGNLAAKVTNQATVTAAQITVTGPTIFKSPVVFEQGFSASGGATATGTINGLLVVNGTASCTTRFSNADGSGGGS
jgi:phage baseplate assembly protein gpV